MAHANGNNTTTAELMARLLLNREQVAELLGVKPGAVDQLHRVNLLPACKVGCRLVWKPETVREYVENLIPGN